MDGRVEAAEPALPGNDTAGRAVTTAESISLLTAVWMAETIAVYETVEAETVGRCSRLRRSSDRMGGAGSCNSSCCLRDRSSNYARSNSKKRTRREGLLLNSNERMTLSLLCSLIYLIIPSSAHAREY